MSDISNGKAGCLTLTWVVENFHFSTCRTDEEIRSPTFEMGFLSNMKLCMMLYPREIKYKKEYMVVELHPAENVVRRARVHMHYELSFLNANDLPVITTGMKDITVSKHGFCATLEVEKNRVPMNTLRIRCRLWPTEEMPEEIHCTARTQLEVERVFFKKVVDSTCFQIREEAKIQTCSGSTRFSVILYSTEVVNNEKRLFFEIVPDSFPDKAIIVYKLYILDDEGQVLTSEQDEINCTKDEMTKVWKIPMREGWKKLDYYFGKPITFCGECFVSRGNIMSNVIEETRCGFGFDPVKSLIGTKSNDRKYDLVDSCISNKKNEKLENSYGNAHELAADICTLYEEGVLSDLQLKTKTSVFSVHKFILSARSPVFKEMLTNGFDGLNVLYLTYLDDDTVSNLLTYAYKNLTTLNWDIALKLYTSANKFEMFSLRDRCSHFLQKNLNPHNVCEVLKMATSCNDSYLLHAVYNYIENHRTEVLQSNSWMDFEITHCRLAVEALRCISLKTSEFLSRTFT